MNENLKDEKNSLAHDLPTVMIASFASCFGCQLQITNEEAHLTEILDQVQLLHWQLTTQAQIPDAVDVLIVEGAITTSEAKAQLAKLANSANTVIAIGACAVCGGIVAMSQGSVNTNAKSVYTKLPKACGQLVEPVPVSAVVDVDFKVPGCPIDTMEFVDVLQQAVYGSNKNECSQTMCGSCKLNGSDCFFENNILCMGLVTQAGCNAKCVAKGKPCSGCRGVAPAANLESARQVCKNFGVSVDEFNNALQLFNKNSSLAQTQNK